MLSRSSPTDRDALTTKDAPAALRTPAPAAARQARPNDVPSEALSTQEKRGQLHISFAAASRGALRRRLCANARAGVAMCAVVCRARSRVGAPAVGRPSRRRARCCAQRPGRGAPGAGGGAEGREGAPLPKRLVRRAEQDIDQLDRWQREATEEHWSQGGLRRDIFAGDVRGACLKRAAWRTGNRGGPAPKRHHPRALTSPYRQTAANARNMAFAGCAMQRRRCARCAHLGGLGTDTRSPLLPWPPRRSA